MKKIITMLLLCGSYITHAQSRGPYTGATTVNTTGLHVEPAGGYGYPNTGPVICATSNPVTTAQWHYAGQQNTAGSVDWIYSLITTTKKETITCGYSQAGAVEGVPFIQKLDHTGKLAWLNYQSTTTCIDFSSSLSAPSITSGTFAGFLWSVTKASDGYVAVGAGDLYASGSRPGFLIVEFDDAGNYLNGTPITVIPHSTPTSGTAVPAADITAYGYSVAIDPNTNSVNNIIVGGRITGTGSELNGAGIVQLNYASGSWSLGNSFYGPDPTGSSSISGSTITKLLTQSTGSGYNIYACGTISVDGDNASGTGNFGTHCVPGASPAFSAGTLRFAQDKQQPVL